MHTLLQTMTSYGSARGNDLQKQCNGDNLPDKFQPKNFLSFANENLVKKK